MSSAVIDKLYKPGLCLAEGPGALLALPALLGALMAAGPLRALEAHRHAASEAWVKEELRLEEIKRQFEEDLDNARQDALNKKQADNEASEAFWETQRTKAGEELAALFRNGWHPENVEPKQVGPTCAHNDDLSEIRLGEELCERLRIINPKAAAKPTADWAKVAHELGQRRSMTLDSLKLAYGRELETATHTLYNQALLSELMNRLKKVLPANHCLLISGGKLLAAKKLNNEDMDRFNRELGNICEKTLEEKFFNEVADESERLLVEMGYEVLDENGEAPSGVGIRFFQSPDPDYRVMMRLNSEGRLAAKLMRVVYEDSVSEQDLSEYQRLKDVEVARKWCAAHDRLQEGLAEAGFKIDNVLKKKPEETDLQLIAVPRKSKLLTAVAIVSRELKK